MYLVNVVCCQLELSATGRSFVLGSPTEQCVFVGMCVCVCVCVSWSVIRCDSKPLHLQWVGTRGQNKQGRRQRKL